MEKIFAPIDGKNVGTDWIDDIFDYSECTKMYKYSHKKVCGFVNGQLVECVYTLEYNTIEWRIYALYSFLDDVKAELLRRLKKYENEENELFSEYEESETYVIQRFYWKED